MRPSSGLCAPESTFINVLLPAPFSPTKAKTSPARTDKSTPSSAMVAPKRFRTPSIRSSSVCSAMGKLLRIQQLLDFRRVHVLLGYELCAAVCDRGYLLPMNISHYRFHSQIAHFLRILGHKRPDFAFFQTFNQRWGCVEADSLNLYSKFVLFP